MRAVGYLRAPACVKVGTPCFSYRDLGSLQSLGVGNQIAGGLVGLPSCTFVGTLISRLSVLAMRLSIREAPLEQGAGTEFEGHL